MWFDMILFAEELPGTFLWKERAHEYVKYPNMCVPLERRFQ